MKNSLQTIFRPFLRHITILAVASVILFACDGDDTGPSDPYGYYPTAVGHYIVYQVDQEVYSTGQTQPAVSKWQEKDEIDRIAADSAGIVTYIVARSTRSSSSDYWQKVKEYTIQKYPDKLLTNIDNLPFLSLTFPIDSRTTWNGNSYNSLDKQQCFYESVNKPAQVNDQSFADVLTVVERFDTSIINRYVTVKQYGRGVGLISDDQTAFEFCQNDECIGSKKIESGSHKSRKILEFGSR